MVVGKTQPEWNLIRLISDAELKRIFPHLEPSAARAKCAFNEIKAHPRNKVDLGLVEELFNELEGRQSVKKNSPGIKEALDRFLMFCQAGDKTRKFYSSYLGKALPVIGLTPRPEDIVKFRDNLKCQPGGKHAYHRSLRAFFNWLYSPASNYSQFKPESNPIRFIKSPKVPKKRMPAINSQTFKTLFSSVNNVRDAAILAVLIETGGRRSEVSSIRKDDILWDQHSIKTVAKGNREVLMPISPFSENLLKEWLSQYHPQGEGNIWGMTENGFVSMLRRLEKTTGIKCNAHTFRRGFASILRRNGVDILDIMKLGHWQSMSMVQRYSESVDFEDSYRRYKGPAEELVDATRRLHKSEVVPRIRVELMTRGFSVRQQELCLEILRHLSLIGQAASTLLQSFNSDSDIEESLLSLKKMYASENLKDR